MAEQTTAITELAVRARGASRRLAIMEPALRTQALLAMAEGIAAQREAIMQANEEDLRAAQASGLSGALLDRLLLNESRLTAMIRGIRNIADLPDTLGMTLGTYEHPAGMRIRKVRVPLGVVLIIYESRPNVTADAAALCFKSGNAVILRGGSEAMRTNRAILEAMVERLDDNQSNAIQLVSTAERAVVRELLTLDRLIDLVIPRGGEGLIRTVAECATMPVLKHYKGVCHVYVDHAADEAKAERIVLNAKCQRPGVCNAIETLLVHESIASTFIPRVASLLHEQGVAIRGDERVRELVSGADAATEDDWKAEYLDLILAVRVVPSLDAAIDHIEQYGSRHSDAIVSDDRAAAARFLREVDSAAVYVNASTRFTDGAEFGIGAEVGISTDKLHARGPCGIEALTTYKYMIEGSGQVRE